MPPKKPQTRSPREQAKRLNILFYGQPGSGKTYLIGTAAKAPEIFGRILLLATDPGTLTLAFDADMNRQIEVAHIQHTDDLDDWYEWLLKENKKQPPEERYGTIGFDGLTDQSAKAMLEALDASHQANSQRDPDMPAIDHHQKVKIATIRDIIRFRDLPDLHFFATALEKQETDIRSGATYTVPSVGSGMAKEVAAFFDIVGYLTTKTDKEGTLHRYLKVHNDGLIIAKDRTQRLGKFLVDPTLPEIYRLIAERADGAALTAQGAEPKITTKKPKL